MCICMETGMGTAQFTERHRFLRWSALNCATGRLVGLARKLVLVVRVVLI